MVFIRFAVFLSQVCSEAQKLIGRICSILRKRLDCTVVSFLGTSASASTLSVKMTEVRLCSSLKCQSVLHMAMFHHKQRTAIKYSKTLMDHFSVRRRVVTEPSFSNPPVDVNPLLL